MTDLCFFKQESGYHFSLKLGLFSIKMMNLVI